MSRRVRYISLFSGMEAASCAFEQLGIDAEPVAFAEIDPVASAFLAQKFPHVPNLGDVTSVDWSKYRGQVDIVFGGSPCQSFSHAGKRLGLSDPRGNLALHYLRVVQATAAPWFVYENVPGMLSADGSEAFESFLGTVAELGYSASWSVLDARHFGVPQRRRRLWVVGRAGDDWGTPAAILFEPESEGWNSPAGGKKGKEAAAAARASAAPVVSVFGDTTHTLTRRHDSSEDGCGRGTPIIAYPASVECLNPWDSQRRRVFAADGLSPTLSKGSRNEAPHVAYAADIRNGSLDPDVTMTVQAAGMGKDRGICANAIPHLVYAARTGQTGANGIGVQEDAAYTLDTSSNQAVAYRQVEHGHMVEDTVSAPLLAQAAKDGMKNLVLQPEVYHQNVSGDITAQGGITAALRANASTTYQMALQEKPPGKLVVRRLTPLECVRLQGFPDDWFDGITYKGKPLADSGKYRLVGNSWAVPVAKWIIARLLPYVVEDIQAAEEPFKLAAH